MNICSTLCHVLSLEDYENIMRVTDTSKDAEYQKSKRNLKEKYQQLKNENQRRSQIVSNNKGMIMKPAVFNLTSKTIDKNVTSLLNLGPKFVLTPKSILYMEIITARESQALKLESDEKDTSAENLRQTVNKILSTTISKKQNNLSKTKRTALKQLKNDQHMKVYPFDDGIGFALLNDIDNISKIEEQLGKSKIIDHDPTSLLTGKFQRLL